MKNERKKKSILHFGEWSFEPAIISGAVSFFVLEICREISNLHFRTLSVSSLRTIHVFFFFSLFFLGSLSFWLSGD
jgi:hypothetical protein